MPRSSRRTPIELASDLAFILASNVHEQTKLFTIKNVVWAWTKGPSGKKYTGCKFWSRDALDTREAGGEWRKRVHHEHAVPIAALARCLLRLNHPTPEQVHDVLERLAIGVVVTREEHRRLNALEVGGVRLKSRMPKDFDCTRVRTPAEALVRYRDAQIALHPPEGIDAGRDPLDDSGK